jgi:hypothetical protein
MIKEDENDSGWLRHPCLTSPPLGFAVEHEDEKQFTGKNNPLRLRGLRNVKAW